MKILIFGQKSVEEEQFKRNCQTLFSDQKSERVSNLGSNIQILWVIASDFFEAVDRQNEVIYVSGFVQKELKWLLTSEEFSKRTEQFEDISKFRKTHANDEDYRLGRALEQQTYGKISFFDCMHITLSKRLGAVLITRDKMLIETAHQNGCPAYRPEELKMN